MFQTLRVNSPIYILHKEGTPYVEQGVVVSVSNPMPKFPMPNTPMQPFGQAEMVVDVVANVNGQNISLTKLAANKDIDDSPIHNVIVTTSRDAMNSEILARRQRSVDIVNSTPYHSNLIEEYDKIYKTLNPEFAEKQRRDQEMDDLRGQVTELTTAFRELMATLQSEKQAKTKKTE